MEKTLELTLTGDHREPVNDRLFVVTDSAWTWVVNGGTVDLFVQESRRDERTGPLHWVTRVPAGEAIFGNMSRNEPGVLLIAIPAPDSRVTRIAQASLQWELEHSPGLGHIVEWIERWVFRMTQTAARRPMPKKFVPLEAGQKLATAERAEIVAPLEGVLWIKHLKGGSRFLAESSTLSIDGEPFPVCKHGWIEVEAESTLLAQSTLQWHTEDRTWEALQSFHAAVMRCLVCNLTSEAAEDEERLFSKFESSRALTHNAFSWLAHTLARKPWTDEENGGKISPLVSAFQAAAREMGITLSGQDVPPKNSVEKDPVMALARASAVRARRVVLDGKWWKRDGASLVAFLESNDRPVALLRRPSGYYEMYDPVEKTNARLSASLASKLSGVAYSIYRPLPEKSIHLRDLLAFGLGSYRRDLSLIVGMGLGATILSLIVPVAMGIMFDSAIPGAQRQQVVILTVFLVMSAVCSSLFSLTRSFAVQRLKGKLDATLQAAAWDRLLRLPATFFRAYSSGDLAGRSLAFKEIGDMVTGPVLSLLLSQIFSVLSFGVLFVYSWQLALISSLLLLTGVAVSLLLLKVMLNSFRTVMELRGRATSIVMELVNGVAKFRVSGTEDRAFAVWARTAGSRRRNLVRARIYGVVMASFRQIWPVISIAIIYYCGVTAMSANGGLSTGSFLAFITVFTQVMGAALSVATSVQLLLSAVPLYERAKPILEALPEVDRGKAFPGELRGAIEVNSLTFRYTPDGPAILNQLSIKIEPGESVAIVGPSGCGKSTLFRLLLGFEKPESGAVYYDGQDLAGLDVQSVREQIGTVLQSAKIGTGTILSLILASSPLTVEDAWEAARMTGLDKDIADMPMGMRTSITEGGGTLSGGQKQRLVIAAAIVNRPRILFFDEATSALDNETQAIVTRSLESLRATRVVIAHRLSTVINADRILVLEKGSVIQSGTYQELLSQPGPFRELAVRQLA